MPYRATVAAATSHWNAFWSGFMDNFTMPPAIGLLFAGFLGFPGVLNQSVLWMLALAFLSILIDFLAGVYFALRRKDDAGQRVFSIDVLYDGGWKKLGRTFLILVAGLWDAMLWVLADFMGQQAVTQFQAILPWTMLASIWIVVGESASTIQTITLHGGESAVPAPFRKMVKKLQEWLQDQEPVVPPVDIPPAEIPNPEDPEDATP